jgi:ADP-heptose:LPS heptosyltransferase
VATRLKILFLIRDKLGDSLIAANVALLFARRNPEYAVSVMIRDAYVAPLAHEPELRLIPYRSGIAAWWSIQWWRITRRRYDAVGLMRGFGARTRVLIRKVPTRRVVVHDLRLTDVATDVAPAWPAEAGEEPHYGPAWRVARVLDGTIPEPESIRFPGLATRWQATPKRYVIICPLSDEHRRNIPADAIESLHSHLRRRYPDREVLVLVRQLEDLRILGRQPAVPVMAFREMPELIGLMLQSSDFYGTDTGLLHLAAAMGMPSTAFFGPTQPGRVMPHWQPGMVALRRSILGDRHCEIKACTNAVCIAQAVGEFTGDNGLSTTQPTLPDCLLRG